MKDNQLHTMKNQLATTSQGDVGVQRELATIQMGMVIAKQFPRNQAECIEEVLDECKRFDVANNSQYSFPRGGRNVSGPTISLLKLIAGRWRNLDSARNGANTNLSIYF